MMKIKRIIKEIYLLYLRLRYRKRNMYITFKLRFK